MATSTHGSFTLPAGDYEYLIQIPLDRSAAETITGHNHEYHSYQVQVIIERGFGKDFVVSRPIRIYKDFELAANCSWPSSPVVRVTFFLP